VIGAALASCYAQSLSRMLSDGGQEPRCVRVTAAVDIVFADGSTHIPQISLDAEIDGLDLDVDQLQQVSQQAADRCPICGALAGTTIRINARPAPPPGD
jgi:organic hydroperoxide reductase OsmC/OhrA